MTLRKLIKAYRTDPVSGWHRLRYSTRRTHGNLLNQIERRYGRTRLKQINARRLIKWHAAWVDGTKFHAGHAFVKKLRTVFGFGLTILEDRHCQRLRVVMHTLRFPAGKKRTQRLTAHHALAIIKQAHRRGWHSIALAQALQFELMLRQKDVIGEWIPRKEPGETDVFYRRRKWLRGLRGSEIDANLILVHTTSKRQKDIEADLTECPMIVEVLKRLRIKKFPPGPLVINEFNGRPYTDYEFRRKWRICAEAAGIPKDVFQMDTRAGAISEAFEAEANADFIRDTATHSDLATTQGYNRGSHLKRRSSVMRKRVAGRAQNAAGAARCHSQPRRRSTAAKPSSATMLTASRGR